jgi:hypothetical protein
MLLTSLSNQGSVYGQIIISAGAGGGQFIQFGFHKNRHKIFN